MIHQKLQGFGANASIPKGFSHPIANRRLVGKGRQVALSRVAVADGAYKQIALFQHDSPCGVVAENGANDVQTLFDGLVRCPARPRPYIGVGGVLVQK